MSISVVCVHNTFSRYVKNKKTFFVQGRVKDSNMPKCFNCGTALVM